MKTSRSTHLGDGWESRAGISGGLCEQGEGGGDGAGSPGSVAGGPGGSAEGVAGDGAGVAQSTGDTRPGNGDGRARAGAGVAGLGFPLQPDGSSLHHHPVVCGKGSWPAAAAAAGQPPQCL